MGLSTEQIIAYKAASKSGLGYSNLEGDAYAFCDHEYSVGEMSTNEYADCLETVKNRTKPKTDWTSLLNNAFSFGNKIIDNKGNASTSSSSNYKYDEPEKTNPAVYVIGGLAVAGAIYGIYKLSSK